MNILYVEDNAQDADLTVRVLSKTAPSLHLSVVHTLHEARHCLQQPGDCPYDLVLADMHLPDGLALTLLQIIRQQHLPLVFVVVTGTGDEETAVAALKAGADDYVVKQADYLDHLPSVLQNAMHTYRTRKANTHPLRVLYAEDNPLDIDLTCRHLARYASHIQIKVVGTAAEVLARLADSRKDAYDLLLADYLLPDMNAIELFHALRHTYGNDLPVVLVTGQGSEEVALQALKLGVADYVVKTADYLIRLPAVLDNAFHLTQLKREQAALRESEARYRIISELSSDFAFALRMNVKGRWMLEWITDAFWRLTGYVPGDMSFGIGMTAIIHPDDRVLVRRTFEALISGQDQVFEFRMMSKSGRIRWLRCHMRPVWDKDRGGIARIYGAAQDITERKEAEETWQRYQLFHQHSRDIILFVRYPDGQILEANRAAAAAYGYSHEELLALNIRDLHHPETRPLLTIQMAQANQAGIRFETIHCRKDGSTFPVEVNSYSIPVGEEQMLFSVARDITERKHAEEQLANERNLLRTLIDNVPDLIYVKDTQGRFLVANEAIARIMGADGPHGLLGKTDFDFYPAELAIQYHSSEQELLRSERPILDREEMIVDSQGRKKWLSTTKVPLYDREGQMIGLVGMGRDITARKQLEEQFRQAQKMEAIGRLAGGVAHDFNNLLTVINGSSELLLEELDPSDSLAGDVKNILDAGERAARLARQLLVFSRRQIVETRILNLNEVLLNLGKMLSRLIGEDMRLEMNLDPQLANIRADAGQLEQVVVNLAVNARDAMPQGGTLSLTTANVTLDDAYENAHVGLRSGSYVSLSVTDTGTGMPPEVLQHLFEPFFTTKAEGKGTGLGLATVYGIIHQSEGDIRVYSEVGYGSTFRIYLPRVQEVASEHIEEALKARGGSETILVVEDQEPVRRITARMLKDLGYSVLEAADGAAAIQLCRDYPHAINLLLTDVVMPEMGGKELAEQLTLLRQDLRVLYMTGFSEKAVTHLEAEESDVQIIQKPFSSETLARQVRQILDGSPR